MKGERLKNHCVINLVDEGFAKLTDDPYSGLKLSYTHYQDVFWQMKKTDQRKYHKLQGFDRGNL